MSTFDKIPIALQIAEAEQHARELSGPASKNGKGASESQLRYRAALAIISTLSWLRDNEQAIKAAIAERKS